MDELTSPMFFLIPSLIIAWALQVLEGLHLLVLMGFSREQQRVSSGLLGLMPLPLQVTWSLWETCTKHCSQELAAGWITKVSLIYETC